MKKNNPTGALTDIIMGSMAMGIVNQSNLPGPIKSGTEGLIGLGVLKSATKKFKL